MQVFPTRPPFLFQTVRFEDRLVGVSKGSNPALQDQGCKDSKNAGIAIKEHLLALMQLVGDRLAINPHMGRRRRCRNHCVPNE